MKYDKKFMDAMYEGWKRCGEKDRLDINVGVLGELYADIACVARAKGFKRGFWTAVTVGAAAAYAYKAWKNGRLGFSVTADKEEEMEEPE